VGVSDRVYLDRPNVIDYHSGLRADSNGTLVDTGVLDLAYTPVAVGRADRADAFRLRLEQGVLDTVLEGLLLPDAAGDSNVSDLFARAARQRGSPRTVRAADAASLLGLPLPPDPAERMRDALAAGQQLVIPGAPADPRGSAFGWWRVDGRTGDTVGVMASGFNQGNTDKAISDTYVPNQFIVIARGIKSGMSLMNIYGKLLRVGMAALYQMMYFMNNTLGVDMKTPGFWGWFNRVLLQLKIALVETYHYRVLRG
jgi:hypothetical protein